MSNGLPPPPPPAPPTPPFAPPPAATRAVPAARRPSTLLPLLVVGGLAFFAVAAAVAVAGMILYMNGGVFSRPIDDTPAPVVETRPAPSEAPPVAEPTPEPPPPEGSTAESPAPAASPDVADREPPAPEATAADERRREPRPRPGGTVGSRLGGFPEAPPPPPPPIPIRVGGQIRTPAKIRDVRPVYPAIAQQARIQGIVIIEATISPQGTVQDTRVVRSIRLLDEAALRAVSQWQYEPTYLNGVAVPVIMTVTVNFTLSRD